MRTETCVGICLRMCIHACVHQCLGVSVPASKHTHACMYTCVYLFFCSCARAHAHCVHPCMCAFVRVCVCACVRVCACVCGRAGGRAGVRACVRPFMVATVSQGARMCVREPLILAPRGMRQLFEMWEMRALACQRATSFVSTI